METVRKDQWRECPAHNAESITDGPWSSIPLQLGGGNIQKQNVRVFPSTAAYNTWVINSEGCPDWLGNNCATNRGFLFNKNDSLTYLAESIYDTEIEKNLGLATIGYGGYETIQLGWQGSGGPSIDHMPLFDIADPKYWDGLFGLNPLPTNFSTLNNPQPSYMHSLYNQSKIPSISYGYTAGNQYRFNQVYGSLTLGGYDSNRFTPTETTFNFYQDIERDLLVNLKSISANGTSSALLPDGEISIYLDSTIATIWLPESACAAFESAFGLTYNYTAGRYLVNDTLHESLLESNPSITFTLANNTGSTVDITLPYAAFDLTLADPMIVNGTVWNNGTSSRYFPLQRAANDTQYTLGRTFFQEAYLIADYSNGNFTVAPCAWDEGKVTATSIENILSPEWKAKTDTEKSRSGSSSSFSSGAIAGVVVGIVAVIALLLLALWLVRRKKKQRAAGVAHLASQNADTDAKSIDGANGEGKPFISQPMGGELGGDGEIHELTAPHKNAPAEMDSPYRTDPNKVGYSEVEGAGYFGPGKGGAHEMSGSTPVFEMEGSAVQELGPGRRSVEEGKK
jgi:hypothetical protein